MNEDQVGKTGGFHFGNVGGNVQINAGGDLVAGDKISKLVVPFDREEDRANFQHTIQELKAQLEEIQAKLDASNDVATDTKVQLSHDLAEAHRELSETRDASGPPRTEHGTQTSVTAKIEKVGSILQRIETVAGTSLTLADKIGPLVSRAVTMFVAARGLLGIP